MVEIDVVFLPLALAQLALSSRNLADPLVCRPTGDNEEARSCGGHLSSVAPGHHPPSPPLIHNSEAISPGKKNKTSLTTG